MKNLLTLIGAAVVCFLAAGWYLGWYKIQSTPGPDGHRQINVDVNTPRIREDLQRGREKVVDLITPDKPGTAPNQALPGMPSLPTPPPTVAQYPQGTPQAQPQGWTPPAISIPGVPASFQVNKDGVYVYPGNSQPQQQPVVPVQELPRWIRTFGTPQ